MTQPAKVLDVGNCDPDHGMLRGMLEKYFAVEIHRVMFVHDALMKMRDTRYDLVLFNRLIFDDGSEGMELLRAAKADPVIEDMPIMMISNFEDAQAQAVAAGGVRGFGKAAVHHESTVKLLSNYLERK